MSDEASRALPPVPLEPLTEDDPSQLGNYRLLGRLGAGGMGVAYLASDSARNWIVVKTIWPHLAADRAFRARLVRELQVMRTVSGGTTAALLNADTESATPWFAMEFIPGTTLARKVEDSGPLSSDELNTFALDLLRAVQSVHAAGVTHRDLKPANIMLSPTGPRLIDFGVADLEGGTQLTRTGAVLGSTGWLAPEQVRGDDATAATDMHAWALCVLYAATGTSPFGAENSATAIYRVLETTPDVPAFIEEPLRSVVTAALAKDPLSRPTPDQAINQLNGPPAATPARTPTPPIPPPATAAAPLSVAAAPPRTSTVEQPPLGERRWFGPLNLATGPAVLLLAGVGMVVIALFITLLNGIGGDDANVAASPEQAETFDITEFEDLDIQDSEFDDFELVEELDDFSTEDEEAGCARYRPYLGSEGETVSVLTWYYSSLDEDREFEEAWRDFEQCTGITIEVEYEEWSTDYLNNLIQRARDGSPPDIVVDISPGALAELEEAGVLTQLPTGAMDNLDRYWQPFWRTYSSVNGTAYATPLSSYLEFQFVYSPVKFSEWGYQVPKTWQETKALSDTMVAEGRKPWCGGLSIYAGDAVMWLSFLVLSMHGPEVYDSWLSGSLPFDSPEIRASMAELDDWMKNPQYVNGGFGGVKSIVNTFSGNVPAKVQSGDCGMTAGWYFESEDDLSIFLVAGDQTSGRMPAMTSARLTAGLTDGEAVQKVQSFLASPDFATIMAALSDRWTSVNKGIPSTQYRTQRQAQVAEILNSDTSLLMSGTQSALPGPVERALREGLEAWFAGKKTTRQVLRESDQAWARTS
jgi:hypothetical protein